jgi:acetyl esterase
MPLRRAIVAAAALALSALPLPALAQENGPPADIAAELRALGPVIDPPTVMKLYRPLLADQPTDGVKVTQDISYGADERNRLDLYEPEIKPAGPMPVLIFVHGGGFTGGGKYYHTNIGYYFARHGILTINMTYRLAPKAKWPAGAEDVGLGLAWARANAAAHGGDPERIVLMGHSAGAAHIAAYTLTEDLHPASGPSPAGIILISGTYDVALEYSAAAELGLSWWNKLAASYYGTDSTAYPHQSIVRRLAARKLAVMLVYAELDPPWMQIEAGEFFTALCERTKSCPALVWLAGHDHMSEVAAFNTPDDSLAAPVLSFLNAG